MVWFRLALWHINHCWLSNAKSSLYIYIKYIWFGFVWLYGISTIVGYFMPNPFYSYIEYMITKHFVDKIFKQAGAHFLHTSKWFHLISNN